MKAEAEGALVRMPNREAIARVAAVAQEFNSPIAVLILADGNKVRTVSWGRSKRLCAFAGCMGDVAHQAVMEWDGVPRKPKAETVQPKTTEPPTPKRGLVCCFCGEGFGYEGEQPTKAILREAVEHESKCPRNPYLAEIARLRAALESIHSFPVHSEPVGGAYAMQDIAAKALALELALPKAEG